MAKQNHSKDTRPPVTGIRLPLDLKAEVQEVAAVNDRNFSAEVRRALRLHVDRERTAA